MEKWKNMWQKVEGEQGILLKQVSRINQQEKHAHSKTKNLIINLEILSTDYLNKKFIFNPVEGSTLAPGKNQ